MRRAPGVGPLEYHLRLRPHSNRPFRRLLSYLLRGQHPASRDRLRVRRGSRTRRIGTFRDVVVIRGIGRPGVSAKTEAYGFYRPRNRLPNGLVLSSGGFRIGVGRTFKYLGVAFNSGLSFGQHLALLGSKIRTASASLGRLMPNPRGPRARVRRVFATVVYSVALYAAQVWAESVAASRPLRERAIQLQRASLD